MATKKNKPLEILREEVITEDLQSQLTLFAVRNGDGQWFRSKGYGGYGSSWINTLASARIYTKIGPARAVVSYFSNRPDSNQYKTPEIVQFVVGKMLVLDENKRVQKVKKQKAAKVAKQELNYQKFLYESAQKNKQLAEQQLKDAEQNLKKLEQQ